MSRVVTVPTIEHDGRIGELRVDGKYRDWHVDEYLGGSGQARLVKKHFYKLMDYTFALPLGKTDRRITTQIYVSQEYRSDEETGLRLMAIQKFVMEHAAWFFSFGERREDPNPMFGMKQQQKEQEL